EVAMSRRVLEQADIDQRWAFPPDETGALLGLSPAVMDKHIKSGAIASVRLGGRRLVTEQAKTLRTSGMVVFGQPSANSRFVPAIFPPAPRASSRHAGATSVPA